MALIASRSAACWSDRPSTFQDREPQGGGLGCRQLIEQAGLAIGCGIQAEVPQRAGAHLVLPARDAHHSHPIAQVVVQNHGDAAAGMGRWRLAIPAAGTGIGRWLRRWLRRWHQQGGLATAPRQGCLETERPGANGLILDTA
ncbi:hypothetical protein [Synechococcus sp. CBW1002]|uniref:hypothetical protein n=1 Tax=Synechococcus sp. CBW1002 TaxID=1353134 RepID=UPI001E3F765F|nr:hypothetical protein [Synechococcus sp. CBW1002]